MDSTPPGCNAEPQYRAGTLLYTRWGLFCLFTWLLWGDFVFTVMESVEPRILPLLLKAHGASDSQISIVITMVASLLNSIVNPVISYRSDRTRTPLGRRIPYLLFATPFVAVFLALIPFAPEIAAAGMKVRLLSTILSATPMSPVILVFTLLVVMFQLFNMMISSVYYYLFRDVVPSDHLGRFMSLFRCFGLLAGFAFSYWLFPKAETHTRAIFLGASILYVFGFSLMCWRVREGTYLPVEKTETSGRGLRPAIRHFVVQSFSSPIYLWIYVTRTLVAIGLLSGTFAIFYSHEQLHLSLDTIGKIGAWPSLLCIPLAYPLGMLLDRWGSMHTVRLTICLVAAASLSSFFFIHGKWSWFIFSLLATAASFVYNIAQIVWLQRLFHSERMGQLSAASALVLSIVTAAVSPLCGKFIGWMHDYRYVYLWNGFFVILAFIATGRVQHYWQRLGGREHYAAPLPEAPSLDAVQPRLPDEVASLVDIP